MLPARVGLLGGTFDPPHTGHLAAARACRDALALDRLLLVVANDPWQKSPSRSVTPADDRFAMVKALVAGEPGIEASRMEIDRGGQSYTIETVEALRAGAGADAVGGDANGGVPNGAGATTPPEVFLIVGADLVAGLPTWERSGDLQRLVTLVVVTRPRSSTVEIPSGWRGMVLDGGGVDVSSSEIRKLLTEGAAVTGLVPELVVRCIRQRHLYAVNR